LWDTGPNRIVNDFEVRVAEAVERGFNCFRIEGGAGITHDAEGRPRGELEFYPVLPGHDLLTRGQQHMTGGRVDLLKRLIELCTVAKRYNVKLILSSWYYLHTFWFTDKNVTAELLGLPLEKRFMVFARGLDRILEVLKQRGLADTIATAEIFNEVGPRTTAEPSTTRKRWISCKRATRIFCFPWTPTISIPRGYRATRRCGRTTATTCGLSTGFSSKT
jgi:hypothetical protein